MRNIVQMVINIVIIITLLVTIFFGRKELQRSQYAQSSSNLILSQSIFLDQVLPIWSEWRNLHHTSQILPTLSQADKNNFISRIAINQEKWNIVINVLIEQSRKISIADEINSNLLNNDYDQITVTLHENLANCKHEIEKIKIVLKDHMEEMNVAKAKLNSF